VLRVHTTLLSENPAVIGRMAARLSGNAGYAN
jgi:hypothetical protein